jgi:peptidyl-prolyl cis-trans isomerase B (cyclophilin B)
MRRLIPIACVAAVLAGCAGTASSSFSNKRPPQVGTAPVGGIGGAPKKATTSATTTSASTATAQSCHAVPEPAPKGPQHLKAPTLKLNPAKTYTVTVVTNCGSFAFALDVKQQPKTAASFYYLVKRGFYDNLIFHRVVAGFVIQGGDPLGTGQGGPGYQIVEAPPANATYPLGTVAMAKTQTDPSGASGSQFFVMAGNAGLPPQYAIAGKVVSGQATVQGIDALPANQASMPTPAVVMEHVTVKSS